MVEFCAWKTCGRLVRMSSSRVVPAVAICSGSRVATGLMASRVGRGIREPVTSTTCSNFGCS